MEWGGAGCRRWPSEIHYSYSIILIICVRRPPAAAVANLCPRLAKQGARRLLRGLHRDAVHLLPRPRPRPPPSALLSCIAACSSNRCGPAQLSSQVASGGVCSGGTAGWQTRNDGTGRTRLEPTGWCTGPAPERRSWLGGIQRVATPSGPRRRAEFPRSARPPRPARAPSPPPSRLPAAGACPPRTAPAARARAHVRMPWPSRRGSWCKLVKYTMNVPITVCPHPAPCWSARGSQPASALPAGHWPLARACSRCGPRGAPGRRRPLPPVPVDCCSLAPQTPLMGGRWQRTDTQLQESAGGRKQAAPDSRLQLAARSRMGAGGFASK